MHEQVARMKALATQIQEEYLTEWEKFATTWRGYLKYVKK